MLPSSSSCDSPLISYQDDRILLPTLAGLEAHGAADEAGLGVGSRASGGPGPSGTTGILGNFLRALPDSNATFCVLKPSAQAHTAAPHCGSHCHPAARVFNTPVFVAGVYRMYYAACDAHGTSRPFAFSLLRTRIATGYAQRASETSLHNIILLYDHIRASVKRYPI